MKHEVLIKLQDDLKSKGQFFESNEPADRPLFSGNYCPSDKGQDVQRSLCVLPDNRHNVLQRWNIGVLGIR